MSIKINAQTITVIIIKIIQPLFCIGFLSLEDYLISHAHKYMGFFRRYNDEFQKTNEKYLKQKAKFDDLCE